MNIWEWLDEVLEELIDSGDHRLAALILEIPTATCDDNHGAVDAMVPEALALARATGNPWIELFIRHWHLQSRVLHRHEVAGCLSEAVSLYEFAHRPETGRCPQSVCTVQDLAATYGDLDGPGYAAERIEVSRETLAAIDPEWPCFDCISGELAEALLDDGRPGEMLEFVDEQRRAQLAAGRLDNSGNLPRTRAEALIELGRHDEAIAQLENNVTEGGGDHAELHRRLLLARALYRLGRAADAGEVMPAIETVFSTPGHYKAWLDAFEARVSGDESANTWRIGRAICLMQRRLADNGARYLAAELACSGAELALRRGARAVAGEMIERARQQVPELRKPEAIERRIAAVDATLAEAGVDPLEGIDEPAEVLGALGTEPEAALELLGAAAARWPDDPSWTPERAYALSACGFEPEADELLRAHIREHGDDIDAIRALAESMTSRGQTRELREFLDQVTAAVEIPEVRWLIARTLRSEGEIDRCVEVLETIVDEPAAALMLAELHRESGDLDGALELLDSLIERVGDPGPWDWERMMSATLAGRWDRVRDSAARVGMELPGEGPIDLPGPLCQVLVTLDDGRELPLFAARNGPVTARVIQIVGPGPERERYGDMVVIDASELNPSDDADDDEHISIYRAIDVLEHGEYRSFALDGPHPGDAAVEVLRARLEDHDVELQVRSDDGGYRVHDVERDDAELPGLYAVLALPGDREPAELAALLDELTSIWKLPVCWLDLAHAAGDPDLVERHEAIEDRFRL